MYYRYTVSFLFNTIHNHCRVNKRISESGDLSRPAEESGIFSKFTFFPLASPASASSQMELNESFVLGVGDIGIIGRRISVFKDPAMTARVAEGVIGWN